MKNIVVMRRNTVVNEFVIADNEARAIAQQIVAGAGFSNTVDYFDCIVGLDGNGYDAISVSIRDVKVEEEDKFDGLLPGDIA